MKRRPTFAVFLCMVALSVLPLSAQVTTLPAQDVDVAEVQDAAVDPNSPAAQDAVEAREAAELPAEQVVDASAFLNPLVEQEWVVADEDDRIHGTYAVLTPEGQTRGVGGVTINLGRNGVVIQSTVTEPDGHFTFHALDVGAYALVAKSPSSLAAFALHVLPSGASDRLDSNFTVLGSSTAGPIVGQILRAHVVPGEPRPGYYPTLQVDPHGESRRFNQNAVVELTADGSLVGHVTPPSGRSGADLSGNVVHVLKGDRVVGHVATDAAGAFQIARFVPGIYDFVIAGKDGVAIGGFQAVASAGLVQNGKTQPQLVSTVNNQDEELDSLNVELIAPIDWLAGEPEFVLPEEELAMAPVPGGGMIGPGGFGGGGGGMGGGGGGAGGLGGLGGLLGIGGLAAGIAALASEDDGFTIASPQ